MTARSLSLLLAIGVACTTSDAVETRDRDRSSADAAAQLESLASAWFRTSATITFDTQTHDPGEPASQHQCIRQLFLGDGSSIDRPTAVRMCARQGVMRLVWDPPGQWRMDVSNPNEAYAVISTTNGSSRCFGAGSAISRCIPWTAKQARTGTPFRWALATPDAVLDRIGAVGSAAISRTRARSIAGMRAECFWATGTSDQEASWCYSSTGILLFLMSRTSDGWSATLEARRVSSGISERDLSLPG